MAEITLTAETGRVTGSRPSRRLRAEGKVPAVVYGHGSEPQSVAVVWRDLRIALSGEAGLNALLTLEIDGQRKLAMVKTLQRHPVNHTVTHLDFLLVNRDEELTVDVPIVLEGEALGVTRENGMADLVLFHLPVVAKPADIPHEITVDISGLVLGDTVRVADLTLPKGVSTDLDADEAVVVTVLTRAGVEAASSGDDAGDANAAGSDAGGE